MDTPAASLTTRLHQLASNRQHEGYGHVDLELLPLPRAVGVGDQPLTVELPIDGQSLRVGAWRAQVGRATLLLLDSDVDGNPPGLRSLTTQLYGGDVVTRPRARTLVTELHLGPPDVTDVARRHQ